MKFGFLAWLGVSADVQGRLRLDTTFTGTMTRNYAELGASSHQGLGQGPADLTLLVHGNHLRLDCRRVFFQGEQRLLSTAPPT